MTETSVAHPTMLPSVPAIRRVLVLEDNAEDADLLNARLLKAFPGVVVVVRHTLDEARWFLQHESCDFVILDLNLPDSKGIDTLRAVVEAAPEVAVLVHTGQEDSQLARESLKLGAQDYLIKGKGTVETLKRIMEFSLERKMIQRKHLLGEQLLSAFIKYSPAGLVVLDRKLRIITASNRWLQSHALSDEKVTGASFIRLEAYHDLKWKTLLDRCLAAEAVSCSEDELAGPAGERRYIHWEMMPWFDVSGMVGGIIMLHEDVSAQHQMRAALEDANANLERKVQERTSELMSTMILAESAQAAKNEFFTNMTHELRTPLHAIINFSKFGIKKARTSAPEKLEEYFNDIHTSGNRLLGLVNDLLDLTRHKYGHTAIDAKTHAVADLLSAASGEIASILEARSITLRAQVAPEASHAYFDIRRIHQVMLNLIGNAAKFSPEGSVIEVQVSTSENFARLSLPEDMVVLSVLDEGPGIPEAELESVFDEFFQSNKVKSGSFVKGTGLGLAICRQIVQAHGGVIWAENRSGGGAALRFALPTDAARKEEV